MASAWSPRAWLTERGFDPDGDLRASVPPLSKSTPLHQAAHAGELGVCEWLYAHGAAATVRSATNNRGDSPLMAACAQGHLDVAQWLVGHGAAKDVSGEHCWVSRIRIYIRVPHLVLRVTDQARTSTAAPLFTTRVGAATSQWPNGS
jgi:hypothetical protein